MAKSKKRKYARRSSDKGFLRVKTIILVVIVVAGIVVAGSILFAIVFNSENMVKSKITAMAEDYYENYFYEKMVNSEKFKNITDLDAAMEKYRTYGLSPISLNDLLLYDNEKNKEHRKFLAEYCDGNKTMIKYYMEPPYERTSYRMEVTYSCNF